MLTVDSVRKILGEFAPLLSSDALAEACDRWRERFPHGTADSLRRWLAEDAAQATAMAVLPSHKSVAPPPDILDAQADFSPPHAAISEAIARGDLHDWSVLEMPAHALACPRCRMGTESRRKVDELARAAGKKPFGNLADALAQARHG